MKILHINTYDYGGAAIAAVRLHKALLNEGVDSSILFTQKTRFDIPKSNSYISKRTGFVKRQLNKIAVKMGIRTKIWDLNQAKLEGKVEGYESFSFPTSDYDITTQEIYQQADIIHLHWISGFVDYSFFAKNMKPAFWTLHDMNPFTGGCHNSMACMAFKNDCNKCPQLEGTKNIQYSKENLNYKELYLSKSNISIICLSDWMFQNSSESKLFCKFSHYRIDHCIDQDIFKPFNREYCREVLNLPKDKIILLTLIDRFNKGKGSDLLYSAVENISNKNILFCSVGKNPQHNLISYLGNISDERLISVLYSAVDAIVIPSREENSPNVVAESHSCGTPIIAFNIGGIPDHVESGVNGVLAETLSSEALINAINSYIATKNTFSKEKIREAAIAKFDMSHQACKYIEIYKKVICI